MRLAQFSAFYGDRDDALAEALNADIDVLVGDYLAELTMFVLQKAKTRGKPGYATSFISQIAPHLGAIKERGIKVVVNAGGLDPEGCAAALRDAAREAGVELTVSSIVGDDLIDRLPELTSTDVLFPHLDTGDALPVSSDEIMTANAYLGAWPIAEALRRGADIVICPRVTDASVVMGPAAWYFDWKNDDWDRLAGALAAGHLAECGTQVTGGFYSQFDRYDDLGLPGMPMVEIFEDGSCEVALVPGTDGVVDCGTVTAQLLYEIQGRYYHNPDVILDLASPTVEQLGPNRVRVSGARGSVPTHQLKVSLTYHGGYRNRAMFGVTGGRLDDKMAWIRRQLDRTIGEPSSFDGYRWSIVGPARDGTGSFDEITALASLTVKDRDQSRVSRDGFSNQIYQLITRSIPGFYSVGPPTREQQFGVQWPCLIPKERVSAELVETGGDRTAIGWGPFSEKPTLSSLEQAEAGTDERHTSSARSGDHSTVPLRALVGTRSGDKAGNANLGLWADSDEVFEWLHDEVTTSRLRELAPEIGDLEIRRDVLPNLRALNFVVIGWLEQGVSDCTRLDAQAKAFGEFIGAQLVDVPASLAAVARGDVVGRPTA